MPPACAVAFEPESGSGRPSRFQHRPPATVSPGSRPPPGRQPLSPSMIREGSPAVKAGRSTGEEIRAFAASIRRYFQALGAPGDRPAGNWDDVEQNVAVSVVQTEVDYGIPLRGNRGHHADGARKTAGLQISRALSRVSVPDNATGRARAREFQDGIPIAGCGYTEEDSFDVPFFGPPDAGLEARDRGAAHAALVELVRAHVGRLSGARRRALRLLLDGFAEDNTEAARKAGISVQALVSARKELAARVQADEAARRLHRDLIEQRMEQPR